jgi:hypothetical protein
MILPIIIILIMVIMLLFMFRKRLFEKFNNTEPSKKILIISCYGYGNMGDNMYSEVFKKYLNNCEIIRISDNGVFVNKNKKLTGDLPDSDYDFDALILGGGGIITADKLKNSKNIPYYIEKAMQKNADIFIISCGVQGPVDNFERDFEPWKKVMDYAKLITVRSPTDKSLIDKFTDPSKVHYFRDLGYIFPHMNTITKNKTKTTTLIIAGPINNENEDLNKKVQDLKNDTVLMNMGGMDDDDNQNRIKAYAIPGVNIKKYYGSARAKEFDFSNNNKKGDLNLDKTLNIIFNSEIVFTGRYHGMIFSRTLGIPYDTMGMGTNKMLWELPVSNPKDDIIDSYNNIKLLKDSLGLMDTADNDLNNLNTNFKYHTE